MGAEFSYNVIRLVQTREIIKAIPTILIARNETYGIFGHTIIAPMALSKEHQADLIINVEEIRKKLSWWTVDQKTWDYQRFLSAPTVSGISFEYIFDNVLLQKEIERKAFWKIE